MGKYFSLSELTHSDTAEKYNIDNTPCVIETENLESLIDEVLDPIREAWGSPIYVNSGYRSQELNEKINGVSNSQHMRGEAADITTRSKTNNEKLFNLIQTLDIDFDQLIDESDFSWIHISFKSGGGNRNQILKL